MHPIIKTMFIQKNKIKLLRLCLVETREKNGWKENGREKSE